MINDFILFTTNKQKPLMKATILFLLVTLTVSGTSGTVFGNQIPMLNTSQFHFIAQGSYLQLSINSAEIGEQQFTSLTFSQILGGISFLFTSPLPVLYNVLYLPSSAPNSQQLYECFTRAASGGLTQVSCSFDEIYQNSNIVCQLCLQKAFTTNKNIACVNCSSNLKLDITKLTERDQQFLQNGTVLLIIDNTPVVLDTGLNDQIELIMGYEISMIINEDLSSLVYLISIVIGFIVVVLAIIAGYVTIMIKKYDRDIEEHEKKDQ